MITEPEHHKLNGRHAAQRAEKPEEAVENITEHTVQAQETLSHIALKHYRHATRPYWELIYKANLETIGDNPNVVRPGMVLRIPELPEALKDN